MYIASSHACLCVVSMFMCLCICERVRVCVYVWKAPLNCAVFSLIQGIERCTLAHCRFLKAHVFKTTNQTNVNKQTNKQKHATPSSSCFSAQQNHSHKQGHMVRYLYKHYFAKCNELTRDLRWLDSYLIDLFFRLWSRERSRRPPTVAWLWTTCPTLQDTAVYSLPPLLLWHQATLSTWGSSLQRRYQPSWPLQVRWQC